MRRGTRKVVVNLVLFGLAVVVLLYLTQETPESTASRYAWTTVRYETASTKLPESRGICPGLAKSQKPALVVARIAKEDQTWLAMLEKKYHLCVYTADAPESPSHNLQTPANRGHESMAYLTFLIDNYHSIPEQGAVFVHGSRFAWHNDHPEYDNVELLSSLNITAATATNGYHNMRCDWSAGTCSPRESLPQGSIETRSRAVLEPWNERVVSDAALPGALAVIFGGQRSRKQVANAKLLLERTEAVRAQCCAQFVVSQRAIQQHTREEYFALRQWLLDGSQEERAQKRVSAAPADDLIAGRILSYVWHILFIRHSDSEDSMSLSLLNRAACPSAEECYCKLYGKCNLQGCYSPERCRGQYQLPPDFRVSVQDTSQNFRDASL